MDTSGIDHVAIHGNKTGLHGSHQQMIEDFVVNCPPRYSPEAQGMTNPGEGIVWKLFVEHGWQPENASDEIRKAMSAHYKRQKRKR